MFTKSNTTINAANLEGFAALTQRIKDCYSPRANDLERHDAIQEYFRNTSGMLELIQSGRTDAFRRPELKMAQEVTSLLFRESSREINEPLELHGLDHSSMLLALCEVIVSCLTIAQTQDLDLLGGLHHCSRHLLQSSAYETRDEARVRRILIRLPEGQQSLGHLV